MINKMVVVLLVREGEWISSAWELPTKQLTLCCIAVLPIRRRPSPVSFVERLVVLGDHGTWD